MDEDDDRDFFADFGVNDECLEAAITVLQSDVLAVARRGIQLRLCPFLGVDRGANEEQEGEKRKAVAAHGRSVCLKKSTRQLRFVKKPF